MGRPYTNSHANFGPGLERDRNKIPNFMGEGEGTEAPQSSKIGETGVFDSNSSRKNGKMNPFLALYCQFFSSALSVHQDSS